VIVRELEWRSDSGDKRMRYPRFERRVPFDLRFAMAIARAVEARISDVFATPIAVEVFPPVRLEESVWLRLCDGNSVFDMGADAGDLSLVLSCNAARNIVGGAFGEDAPAPGDRLFSCVETRVLERFVAELADGLQQVRGSCKNPPARAHAPAFRSAYCELRFAAPLSAVIGVAFSEKAPQIGPAIAAEVLEDCPIECSVRLGVAALNIFTIAGLTAGDVIPLETKVGLDATLNVGPDPIAAGEGGVLGDRSAFKVRDLI